MIRIVLVRHGETVWHAENRYAGSRDIALSERGRSQAAALAAWAATAGIGKLYVSPLARAIATMLPVAETLSLTPKVDPRLREIDFGAGEGLTSQEMSARFPAERSAFDRDPVSHPLPGGEDPRQAIARGQEALAEIVRDARTTGPHQRVLVVCHSTLIRLLLCDALGINPSRYRRVFPRLDCCALTELGYSPDPHLPSEGAALLGFNLPLSKP